MDREGFRNRMKQYKEARGLNPLLKYWEWKAQPAEKDIPRYGDGTISVGIPSTTSADGRTKYVYYDPTMDLEYQNINLPQVTVTGSKNVGKRFPLRVPSGSYERFKFLGDAGKTIGSFLPIVGEAIDTYDLATDIKNKDWTNSAIRVGSYFIPNIVEKGVKLIKTGIKGLRKYPTIDVNTANEITDKQWDRAYNLALQANDETELLRLRDLHFSAKSNTIVKDKNGIPIETYHTVGDLYNPNFTEFNPTIEGTRSAIYTTDDKLMAGSYSNSYTSEEELEKLHKSFVEKGLSSSMDKTYEFVRNLGLWEPQRQKKLYISLHNPVEIDADSRNWNLIAKHKLPEKLYALSSKFPFLQKASVVTTRDIENLYRRAKDYDGAIIKNVRDYGGGKFLNPEFSPHTVFEVENPANLKLSDAVTYDDVGKVIPLSKRDNFNNRDIRYSFAPIGLAGLTRLEYNIENKESNNYADGGEVQPDTIDPVDMYNKTRYQVNGIPITDKPLSGTDPIGEAVMWGIGGGIASSLIKRSFPRYGGLFAGAMFGDDGKKDNMLVVPKDPSKSNIPVAKNVLNQEVKDYYATDVIPRDIIHTDNQSFITDENFVYDILPNEHFNPGVAGYYDRLNDRIAINNSYATDKNTLDNVMSHEVDHIYNNLYPLDKQHNKILNSAYTVQDDNISRAARSARKPSEKRATNKNLRHSLYTELKEQLGHKPTVKELDEFIDSIPDLELLDRLYRANSYGAAYVMSIEDRAELLKTPVDQYKKTRVSKIRKALKRIAMNEDNSEDIYNNA